MDVFILLEVGVLEKNKLLLVSKWVYNGFKNYHRWVHNYSGIEHAPEKFITVLEHIQVDLAFDITRI